jgi:hypothetical protein
MCVCCCSICLDSIFTCMLLLFFLVSGSALPNSLSLERIQRWERLVDRGMWGLGCGDGKIT